MAGTREGGKAAAATNIKRYGPGFYARIGSAGGKKGTTGGFHSNAELAAKAGSVGGSRSRRTYTAEQRREMSELMKKRWATRGSRNG